jgi:hypothetical protein
METSGMGRTEKSLHDLFNKRVLPSLDVYRGMAPVVPENSCGLRKIDMVKTVDGWKFDNVIGPA